MRNATLNRRLQSSAGRKNSIPNCRDAVYIIFAMALIFPIFTYAITNHPTDSVIAMLESTPLTYPIRFAFLGDSRNSDSIPPGEFGYADTVFAALRNKINNLVPAPVFVIHLGDFRLHGYRYEFERYVAMLDSFDIPTLSLRGNHELYADDGPFVYDSIFGNPDFVFDYGNTRFIFLADCQQYHTIYYNSIDYLLTDEQITWLDSLLNDADERNLYSCVFAHVPPYLPEHDTLYCLGWSVYYPDYSASNTEPFTDTLTYYGVLLAAFGHQHYYDRWTYNDVHYIISGGAGAPLVYSLQSAPFGGSFYHFVLLELYEDGMIKGYVYKYNEYSEEVDLDSTYNFTYFPMGITNEVQIPPKKINVDIHNDNGVYRLHCDGASDDLKIVDIDGRTVSAKKINNSDYIFSLPGNGMFFYRIESNGLVKYGKIIRVK